MKTLPPPDDKAVSVDPAATRRWRLALGALGVAGVLGLFYTWQPQRWDWFPQPPPQPHPARDPDAARLFAPGARVALVAAHPDDAEFYLAGTLRQLAAAGVRPALIVVTDGDKGYQPFATPARNRRVRRAEQGRAAAAWNAAEVVYLGGADGRARATPELAATLARELRRVEPEWVLGFDPDYPPRVTHRDHLAVGRATAQAVRAVPSARWLMQFSTRAPNYAVDVTPDWERRWELLHLHSSQFHGPRRRVAHSIITRGAEADGRFLGTRYAEGFRCTALSE